jgi:hypothetical protein
MIILQKECCNRTVNVEFSLDIKENTTALCHYSFSPFQLDSSHKKLEENLKQWFFAGSAK